MAFPAMPRSLPDNDDAVRIIQALDDETRARLHRKSKARGVHPFRLAAELLRDILAKDEAPPGARLH